jgi:hypothetical protein
LTNSRTRSGSPDWQAEITPMRASRAAAARVRLLAWELRSLFWRAMIRAHSLAVAFHGTYRGRSALGRVESLLTSVTSASPYGRADPTYDRRR